MEAKTCFEEARAIIPSHRQCDGGEHMFREGQDYSSFTHTMRWRHDLRRPGPRIVPLQVHRGDKTCFEKARATVSLQVHTSESMF